MTTDFSKKSFKKTIKDLKKLPNTSGVYYFYDKDDNLLYIGKAKNLKSRISNHKDCNERTREGAFYSQLGKADLSPEGREKLEKAIRMFEFSCMGTTYPVRIDFVFHRTTKIEIEEMLHELTDGRENEMIYKLKPAFNSKTACDEYYEL